MCTYTGPVYTLEWSVHIGQVSHYVNIKIATFLLENELLSTIFPFCKTNKHEIINQLLTDFTQVFDKLRTNP